jgi:hypothetical protein
MKALLAALIFILALASTAQAQTNPAANWWNLTTQLANDDMQGRDTGTEAYQRAATLVADHFRSLGLQPAGDNGTYFQSVAMHQIDLDTAHSSVEIVIPNAPAIPLHLLEETTFAPRPGLPPVIEGPIVFIGYGLPDPKTDLHGKVVVYFNNTPADLSPKDREAYPGRRAQALATSGAVAIVSIDNPAATEPAHWPAAYARTVSLSNRTQLPRTTAPLSLRISAESASKLFSPHYSLPGTLLFDAELGLPIPNITPETTLRIRIATTEKDIASPNILAILPGSDPTLKPEYVVLSAHLDGYGFGTPVFADNLYNGALDDAAYVATLIELAQIVHSAPPKRSLLFCIFTGEEKGLLGSQYFTQHPTVPIQSIVADLNLDQLRPIFPLKALTMEGIADSTLADIARTVAAEFHIELRPDREPERNLYRRADNYSFVRVGVPATGFVFAYNPGTEEERIYRNWYAFRYHKPQDDLHTPIDWAAAAKFNDFYRALALAVANSPTRPTWLATSPNAPKPPMP